MTEQSERKEPKPNLLWDLPIDEGLKCASELREHLSINEDQYLFIAGPLFKDCRSYVLYIALDEVKKASMHLMRLRDLLDEDNTTEQPQQNDRIYRLMLTGVLEEQQMRIRRLLELLVTLILFSSTNEQSYYRHLLLIEDLEQLLSENQDLEDFYGQRSANIDDTISNQIRRIRQVESEIDLSLCWYLRSHSKIQTPKKLRSGQILSTIRSRIKEAIPKMSDTEKLVFGFTYNWGYGSSSETIHCRLARRDVCIQPGEEMTNVSRLSLLIYSILDRCYHLMDKPDAPRVKRISENLRRSDPSIIVHAKTIGSGKVGDFVLAAGNIAEIMEIKESLYGYQSYKVRYLSEKPKKHIQEDWFPAPYIQLLYSRQRFFEKLDSLVKNGKIPADAALIFNHLTEEQIQSAIRNSMKDVWDIALRDWIKGQRHTKK